MSGHTPGPWVAKPDPHSNPGEWVIGIANGPVDYVAVCSERDARLIAAAPELLEVAQRSADALRSAGIEPRATSDNPLEWLLHQTEAAIAKATGGAA